MKLGDLFHERQTDPCAGYRRGSAGDSPMEAVEDVRKLGALDSDARVGHHDLE
jgi:hypothetical protein